MNQPLILGADGKPMSAQNTLDISKQMQEQHRLQAAEFSQRVANWGRFISCETIDTALVTFKGQELTNNGLNKEDIILVHKTTQAANNFFPPGLPQREELIAQVCDAIIGVLSGHPSIMNRPEVLAVIACVKSGAITRKEINVENSEEE